MLPAVREIADYLEALAPPEAALPGDPVGLQAGDPRAPVTGILVALDLDEAVLAEATARQANLVVTHHPLLYNPPASIDESLPGDALLASLIRSRVNVYSVHTNLDAAPRGLNHHLADLLGLAPEGRQVIEITGRDRLLKLVVFVPAGHEETLRQALAEAGAGWIGRYSHCTFQARGTGTFMPRAGTSPFIGREGRLEQVEELRLETILPASRRAAVLEALRAAHPYEEPAYDLYRLEREGMPFGLGLAGTLQPPLEPEQLLRRCAARLKLPVLRYLAPARPPVGRVALCGGSGGSLVETAARLGAEVFISGDLGYHDFRKAAALGLGLIDGGHYGTERPVVDYLADYLRGRLAEAGYSTAVGTAEPAPADWRYHQG